MEYNKEKISFYKLLLTADITAFFGCVSWFFVNLEASNIKFLISDFIAIVLILLVFVFLLSKITFYFKELKEG